MQREMPDSEIMKQFKTIPASNVADVMNRNCAMNPRIHLVSSPKEQMMVGPAYTIKTRAGDNLILHAALNLCHEGDVLVLSNEEDDTRAIMGEVMMAYLKYTKKLLVSFLTDQFVILMRSLTGISPFMQRAQLLVALIRKALEKSMFPFLAAEFL